MHPTPAPRISVLDPVSPAFRRVREVLFEPFDISKWLVLGFSAFLATLGEGGGGGFQNAVNIDNPEQTLDDVGDFIRANFNWLLPTAVGAVGLGVVFALLLTWLRCRGQFMLLSNIVTNRPEVGEPWTRYGRHANSLFFFHATLLAFWLVAALPLGVSGIWSLMRLSETGLVGEPLFFGMLASGGILALAGLLLFVVGKLTDDFVVPIMLLRTDRCLQGWRELRDLFSPHLAALLLYLIFQFVLALAIGTIVIALVLVTCCVAGCLLAIPYVGAVLFLPVTIFVRSYSAFYLAQFGARFDVFAAAAADTPMLAGE